MRKWVVAGLGLMLAVFGGRAEAAQYKRVVDGGTVVADISLKDASRISVMGDRIAAVARKKGGWTYTANPETGDIFVSVVAPPPDVNGKVPASKMPVVSFFVITEKHHTYQMLLQAKDIPSDQIVLMPAGTETRAAASWEKKTPYEETLSRLLVAMVRREAPPGFKVTMSDEDFMFAPGLRLVRREVYVGAGARGEVYEVHNTGGEVRRVTERQFRRPGVRAVALTNHLIAPHASGTAYVIVERGAK